MKEKLKAKPPEKPGIRWACRPKPWWLWIDLPCTSCACFWFWKIGFGSPSSAPRLEAPGTFNLQSMTADPLIVLAHLSCGWIPPVDLFLMRRFFFPCSPPKPPLFICLLLCGWTPLVKPQIPKPGLAGKNSSIKSWLIGKQRLQVLRGLGQWFFFSLFSKFN